MRLLQSPWFPSCSASSLERSFQKVSYGIYSVEGQDFLHSDVLYDERTAALLWVRLQTQDRETDQPFLEKQDGWEFLKAVTAHRHSKGCGRQLRAIENGVSMFFPRKSFANYELHELERLSNGVREFDRFVRFRHSGPS